MPDIVTSHHGDAPWSIRLEEKINYLATFGDARVGEIEELIAAAVEELWRERRRDELAVRGIARWLLAAVGRLPAIVATRPIAAAAKAGAGLQLDGRIEGVESLTEAQREAWLPRLLDGLGEADVGIRLLDGAIELNSGQPRSRVSVSVPRTDPLLLAIGWYEDGTTWRRSDLRLREGENVTVKVGPGQVELRILAGTGIVVRPAGIGRIHVGREDVGAGFAVAPTVVLTAAHLVETETRGPLTYVPAGRDPIAADISQFERDLDVVALQLARPAAAVLPVADAAIGARWRIEMTDWAKPISVTGVIEAPADAGSERLTLVLESPLAEPDYRRLSGSAVSLEDPWGAAFAIVTSRGSPEFETRLPSASSTGSVIDAVPAFEESAVAPRVSSTATLHAAALGEAVKRLGLQSSVLPRRA